MFNRLLFNLTAVFFSFSAMIVVASGQTRPNELPDTTLGKIVREWFKIIETGKENEIKLFIENRFTAQAILNQPDAAQLFKKIYEQSDGLEIVQVTPPNDEFPMMILAKSKRGEQYVRLAFGTDEKEVNKLAGFGIDKAENPKVPKLSEITKSLSEAEMVAVIKREIERRAGAGDFSGTVLLAKNDRILLQAAHGFADIENKIPNNMQTKFHLASVGKMFTAVALAQLVKDGRISYADPVSKYLPEFPNEAVKKITIHQLLTHTAGMGSFFWSPGYDGNRTFRNATEEIAVYKDEKLAFEPGARWRYSNAGFSLLGAIIERVSGKTYLEYVRENIFKPLEMSGTDTNDPGTAAEKAAVLYTQSPADPLGIQPFTANRSILSSHATGFGDGSATALDLFKFARAYRKGKLLGKDITEQIAVGKVSDGGKDSSRWGYGIRERVINGSLVRGHSGGGRTDLQMFWTSGYTIIVQTNRVPLPATALSNEIIAFLTKQTKMQKSVGNN